MNQDRNRNQDMPDRQSNMEKAEGSRDTGSERGLGSDRERMDSESSGSSSRGGITNRSLDRERCEQNQLPERGQSRQER